MYPELLDQLQGRVLNFSAEFEKCNIATLLSIVGGFNLSEKYARQIGSFPQVGIKVKKYWNHHLVVPMNCNNGPFYKRGSTVIAFHTNISHKANQDFDRLSRQTNQTNTHMVVHLGSFARNFA